MFEQSIIAATNLSETVKAMNRYSRKSSSVMDNWPILVAIAAIALFWAVLHFWDKYRKSRVSELTTPQSLFEELCDLHKLGKADRTLLEKVVTAQNLDQPAAVFVDPGVLATAASSGGEGGYLKLRSRLFGSDISG